MRKNVVGNLMLGLLAFFGLFLGIAFAGGVFQIGSTRVIPSLVWEILFLILMLTWIIVPWAILLRLEGEK